MKVLVALPLTWLSSNFDLPVRDDHPAIQLVPSEQLAMLRYGAIAGANANEPIAVYDDRAKTIYLSENWTGATAADISALVHELVHHLQNATGLSYQCPGAREALAYEAQEKWLSLFGTNLLAQFDIDPMTLKLRTACM